MKRLLSRLLDRGLEAVLITVVVSALVAAANQASLFSPTTGTVSGLNLTNNLNSAVDALNTCNSGASAPANQLSGSPALGNCWIDTSVSPKRLRRYDGTSWLILGAFDDTNHIWVPITGGGAVQSIASATTTDLCSANNNFATYVSITGTVTIQSFGSNCATGQIKTGVFTGILTLTHNASSFILPFNGANKTTAAGDTFTAVHLGSGNWRLLPYQNATGSPTIAAPTVQSCASGLTCDNASHTYTPTAGMVRIKVRMTGGGAGGAAAITNNGQGGNTTTFATSWTALGGTGGTTSGRGGGGGTGGGTGTGTLVVRAAGAGGGAGLPAIGAVGAISGVGGNTPFAGGGAGVSGATAGVAAIVNSGSGGSGGSDTAGHGGGGGGAAEYVEFWMTAAQVGASQTYTVGTGGAGGTAGTQVGGAGATGALVVEEFYWKFKPPMCELSANNDNYDFEFCKAA